MSVRGQALGDYGERIAAAHLIAAGMTILDRNWRCPEGEIDIVARDGDALVVCEVKTRRGNGFGGPLEAINPVKAQRLAPARGVLAARARRPSGRDPDRRGRRAPARPWPGRSRSSARGGLMPLARTRSVTLVGVTGHLIEVEADLADGVPAVILVGLPDAAVSEARDRVRAAIVNSGQRLAATPDHARALAGRRCPSGGALRPCARGVAVLAAGAVVPPDRVASAVFLGELGLDGRIRPVRGVLPSVLAAVAAGHRLVVVPSRERRGGRPGPGRHGRRRRPSAAPHGVVARRDLQRRARRPRPCRARAGARRDWSSRRRRRPGPDERELSRHDHRLAVRRPRRRPGPGRGAGTRSRSPRPAGTTCSCTAHPAPASRCWRCACPACCRRCRGPTRSR